MNDERTFTEKEVGEMLALMWAFHSYKEMSGKKLLDEEDKMLITHLKIFADLSSDTVKDMGHIMKLAEPRMTAFVEATGLYCGIMAL